MSVPNMLFWKAFILKSRSFWRLERLTTYHIVLPSDRLTCSKLILGDAPIWAGDIQMPSKSSEHHHQAEGNEGDFGDDMESQIQPLLGTQRWHLINIHHLTHQKGVSREVSYPSKSRSHFFSIKPYTQCITHPPGMYSGQKPLTCCWPVLYWGSRGWRPCRFQVHEIITSVNKVFKLISFSASPSWMCCCSFGIFIFERENLWILYYWVWSESCKSAKLPKVSRL